MKVTLTVIAGPNQGRAFEFLERDYFIVGRCKEAHFQLPFKDRYFSRIHFLVEINPPRCRLMDMASTNGTYVNGRKVMAVDLRDGDVIKGGQTAIAISIQEEGGSHTTTVAYEPGLENTVRYTRVAGVEPPRVIAKYQIERVLGRGGMGVVYLARKEGGSPVALKTITPTTAGSEKAMARFLREASILRQLDHPNIVAFREIGLADNQFFFAMDYVPGADASSLLKQHGGPLPIGRAVDLVCQTLDALTYAHALKFVHRDIKPKNLLITQVDGRDMVKVADFGLSRIYHTSTLSGLTLAGEFAGSVGYLPPEQITNYRESCPASDLYSVGTTLYYLLTGRWIYDFPEGFQKQLLMILEEEPIPIIARRADLPKPLAAIIHRALARDPKDRFFDAGTMRKALTPWV